MLLNQDWQILALKRKEDDTSRPWCWDLPWGWIDHEDMTTSPNDRHTFAIHREIKEELGFYVAEVYDIHTETRYEPDNERIVLWYVFVARYVWQPISLTEHQTYQWCSIDEFCGLDFGPDHVWASFVTAARKIQKLSTCLSS